MSGKDRLFVGCALFILVIVGCMFLTDCVCGLLRLR